MRILLATTPVIACCILASTLHAATIQSSGIAPNNALPGDLVTAFFQVDEATPPDGQAGVWVGGVQQCQALAEHGYFSCAFNVPHGGQFNYELRYQDSVGALTSSAQQAMSGGLRIVKFQPETVQAGRSAIIFAKLDYFHPTVGPTCFMSGLVITAGGIQGNQTAACEIETVGPSNPYLGLLRLIDDSIFRSDGRRLLDVNRSNDPIRVIVGATQIQVPTLSWLGLIALIFGVVLVKRHVQ